MASLRWSSGFLAENVKLSRLHRSRSLHCMHCMCTALDMHAIMITCISHVYCIKLWSARASARAPLFRQRLVVSRPGQDNLLRFTPVVRSANGGCKFTFAIIIHIISPYISIFIKCLLFSFLIFHVIPRERIESSKNISKKLILIIPRDMISKLST